MQIRGMANSMIGAVAMLALSAPAHAQDARSHDVPVVVGGDAITDACSAQGKVTGLDPKGDNFLSLRSGPGGKPFRELERLHGGQVVTICQQRGAWLGVVYAPSSTVDCGVAKAMARARPYRGPCQAGWVHERYIDVVAG